MNTQFPCLQPLRGKGPTAFVIEPGPLATPCWIWLGCLNSKGYPIRGTNDHRYLVHRRVYELASRPLRDGEQAHHLCERRACVNPAHLEALVQLDHSRAHAAGGTVTERALALLADRPLRTRDIALSLGVRPSTVSVALHRAAARREIVAVSRGVWAAPVLAVAA